MTTYKRHDISTLDDVDGEILARRAERLPVFGRPAVGEFVIFADGVERRISHIWECPADDDGPEVWSIQTSDGGSYHLGDGYVSFSGSLFPGVPGDTLTLDPLKTASGAVWFFHHDVWRAHNGVHAVAPFRVWTCSLEAPR